MLIFSYIEDGFVFFNWRRGISSIPREKVFTVTASVCQLKRRFTFLERTILHFLYMHDSCTVRVCNEKLRNDLIKGTDYTPDYLGSIKNDGFQRNIWQNLTAESCCCCRESLFSLLDKLNKLVLTHSSNKLIKLSNNPSSKKVISSALRILWKHRLVKVILLHIFEPQRCHYNLSETDP